MRVHGVRPAIQKMENRWKISEQEEVLPPPPLSKSLHIPTSAEHTPGDFVSLCHGSHPENAPVFKKF